MSSRDRLIARHREHIILWVQSRFRSLRKLLLWRRLADNVLDCDL